MSSGKALSMARASHPHPGRPADEIAAIVAAAAAVGIERNR
jgi:hypothetical protein